MGIIDRLLLREVLKTLLVILVVLQVILLTTLLVRNLEQVASGLLSQDVLVSLVFFQLINSSGPLIPPALFFAVLWVLGRMYRDSEMLALAACGVGTARLYRATLWFALPLAALVAWLVLWVLPQAEGSIQLIRFEQQNLADINDFRPRRFDEFRRGGIVVFTESALPEGGLQGLFVQDRQHDRLGLVTAESATQVRDPGTGARYIVLRNGRRYEGQPGSRNYRIARFDEYALLLPSADMDDYRPRQAARDIIALWISDDLADRAELQRRIAMPLAVLAFVLIAVPLARSAPRKGVYGRLSLAILIYFVYMNMQGVAQRWMAMGTTPAWLGMWWLPVLVAAVAIVLLRHDELPLGTRMRRWRRRA